jgi:hypothetical protein
MSFPHHGSICSGSNIFKERVLYIPNQSSCFPHIYCTRREKDVRGIRGVFVGMHGHVTRNNSKTNKCNCLEEQTCPSKWLVFRLYQVNKWKINPSAPILNARS